MCRHFYQGHFTEKTSWEAACRLINHVDVSVLNKILADKAAEDAEEPPTQSGGSTGGKAVSKSKAKAKAKAKPKAKSTASPANNVGNVASVDATNKVCGGDVATSTLGSSSTDGAIATNGGSGMNDVGDVASVVPPVATEGD